ncbi:endoribonuclease [Bordetella trematum]|nr:endoribonuclease [Bordetella trematum]
MPHGINRRAFLQGTAATALTLSAPFSVKAGDKNQGALAGSIAPTPIWPGGVEKPMMPYTPALKAAGWLFIAGQLASDFETGVAPQAISNGSDTERLALQTRFVMANVAKTVAAAGLDFGRDTARLWQWITSPYPDAQAFAQGDNWPRIPTSTLVHERARFLVSPGPVSTAMGVKALMVKDTRLEVDLIGVDDGTSNEGFESPLPAPGIASLIRRGDWIFLSSESWQRTPASRGTGPQTDQILRHLAGLATSAGASLQRTVKAEVYIGHPSDYAAMEAAWKRWFPKNPPARVVIPRMGLTGGKGRRIEIALILLADNSRKTIDVVHTDRAPNPFGHEPQAVKAGNLLFLSQQMAFDSQGRLAAGMARNPNFPYYGQPSRQQMAYMLKNAAAICEAAGSSLENIVKRVCFHDHGQHFAEAMSEWADHFPGLKPASTSLVLGGPLMVPGAHTLLDLAAYVP